MMNRLYFLLALFFSGQVYATDCPTLLDFNVRTLNENTLVNLCEAYQGKVILVVNTASKCAYTDQYDALEKLYKQYKHEGLVVLGFPSNDFGQQEPGNEQQIKSFCRLTYGVQFPMFAKARVSRLNADPFYESLAQTAGRYPQWNFHKYLIDRKGQLVADYMSAIDPADEVIMKEIRQRLKRF